MDEQDHNKTVIMTVLFSVILLGVIIGVNFAPEVQEKMVEAFGRKAFGLPIMPVVILVELLLFLPAPFFVYHTSVVYNNSKGKGWSTWPFISFLNFSSIAFRKGGRVRRSVLISWSGLAYLIALMIAWIVYASSIGV